MPRRFLIIPGIRQRRDFQKPGDWADTAASWFNARGHDAEAYEYFSTALFRRAFGAQNKRVDACHELLSARGWSNVTLIGHSNGCELICRLLKKCPQLIVDSVHLIAPAVTADFRRNGLNEALKTNQVDTLYVYGSANDRALKLAGVSEFLFGWMGLGYGDLGRVGAKNVSAEAAWHVHSEWRDAFDHSTWFAARHFENTMNLCLR